MSLYYRVELQGFYRCDRQKQKAKREKRIKNKDITYMRTLKSRWEEQVEHESTNSHSNRNTNQV
jgi:hypothetical protein